MIKIIIGVVITAILGIGSFICNLLIKKSKVSVTEISNAIKDTEKSKKIITEEVVKAEDVLQSWEDEEEAEIEREAIANAKKIQKEAEDFLNNYGITNG